MLTGDHVSVPEHKCKICPFRDQHFWGKNIAAVYNMCSLSGFCIALFEQVFGSADELLYTTGFVLLRGRSEIGSALQGLTRPSPEPLVLI